MLLKYNVCIILVKYESIYIFSRWLLIFFLPKQEKKMCEQIYSRKCCFTNYVHVFIFATFRPIFWENDENLIKELRSLIAIWKQMKILCFISICVYKNKSYVYFKCYGFEVIFSSACVKFKRFREFVFHFIIKRIVRLK